MTIGLPQLVIVRLLQRYFNIRNVATIVLITWAQQINFIWSIEKLKPKLIDLGEQKVCWQDLFNSVRRSIQVRAIMYLTLLLIIGHSWRNSSSPHLKSEKSYNPTATPRRIHVDSTWILRRYVEDKISTSFHLISTYFFDVISLVEKSTWFPLTFFDVISLVEKSTWFPRTFFDVILLVKKSTWFPRIFFAVISMVEKSTLFPRTFFDVISMVEKPTLFHVLLSV